MFRRNPLRRLRRGGNAVEYALLLPAYLALTLGTLEWSIFFSQQAILDHGARECARGLGFGFSTAEAETAGRRAMAPYASVIHFSNPEASFSRTSLAVIDLATCTFEADYESLTNFPLISPPDGTDAISASSTWRVE